MVDTKTERPYYDKNILRGGAENIGSRIRLLQVMQMVAAEKTIISESPDREAICPDCFGTGMVSHWSEIAYFEDRRACARCEAGGRVETKIADIVKRARLEERLFTL